jgi:hypothetical protein
LVKSLREASTLDGVLEFRNEHFWTMSFGVLAGSLHVRIRRDADEQLVLAHVWNKLAGIVQILTIHIFKDDWMRRTTHQLVFNQKSINFQTPVINFNPPIAENTNFLVGSTGAPQSTTFNSIALPNKTSNNPVPPIQSQTRTKSPTSLIDSEYVLINH